MFTRFLNKVFFITAKKARWLAENFPIKKRNTRYDNFLTLANERITKAADAGERVTDIEIIDCWTIPTAYSDLHLVESRATFTDPTFIKMIETILNGEGFDTSIKILHRSRIANNPECSLIDIDTVISQEAFEVEMNSPDSRIGTTKRNGFLTIRW